MKITYLEGDSQEWTYLGHQFMAPIHYSDNSDAIEHGSFIIAVDESTGLTYCWYPAHNGKFSIHLLYSATHSNLTPMHDTLQLNCNDLFFKFLFTFHIS